MVEVAGRGEVQPYRQGSLDTLCGVYAIINAIQLASFPNKPLSDTRCTQLFASAVAFLDKRGHLASAATSGIKIKRFHALAAHLAKLACTAKLSVSIQRPKEDRFQSIDHTFAWIEESLACGMPVLVSLEGAMEHYTVIAAANASTLQLFDSNNHAFIRKSNCGIGKGYHRITPNGLLRVAAVRCT